MSYTSSVSKNGIYLGVFALIASLLLALVNINTEEKTENNKTQRILNTINDILPSGSFDNDIMSQCLWIDDKRVSKKRSKAYVATLNSEPTAVIFNPVASDGYNGNIFITMSVLKNGEIGGVRVISHKETPGLGDKIETIKSDWIHQFDGASLQNPKPQMWKVKKDNGTFDQLTGATITPRSVVQAVKNTLTYFQENQSSLLKSQNQCGESNE